MVCACWVSMHDYIYYVGLTYFTIRSWTWIESKYRQSWSEMWVKKGNIDPNSEIVTQILILHVIFKVNFHLVCIISLLPRNMEKQAVLQFIQPNQEVIWSSFLFPCCSLVQKLLTPEGPTAFPLDTSSLRKLHICMQPCGEPLLPSVSTSAWY